MSSGTDHYYSYVLLLPLIACVILGIILVFDSSSRPGKISAPSAIQRRHGVKETIPIIGYKRALLSMNSTSGDIFLSGVIGFTYELEDSAAPDSPGFHMYNTLHDAIHHPQNGNVILEVLGSGSMTKYEKGWVTTEQRVLQIILPQCDMEHCNRQGVGLISDDDSKIIRRISHKEVNERICSILCQYHAQKARLLGAQIVFGWRFTYMHELTSDRLKTPLNIVIAPLKPVEYRVKNQKFSYEVIKPTENPTPLYKSEGIQDVLR